MNFKLIISCFLITQICFSAVDTNNITKEDVRDIYNKLAYIDYVVDAHNSIISNRCGCNLNKSFISNNRYYKSCISVIGKAIADCVTYSNEFNNTNTQDDRIILFDRSDIENYTNSELNALVLYNFLDIAIHRNTDEYDIDKFVDMAKTAIKEYIDIKKIRVDKYFLNRLDKSGEDIKHYMTDLGFKYYTYKNLSRKYKTYQSNNIINSSAISHINIGPYTYNLKEIYYNEDSNNKCIYEAIYLAEDNITSDDSPLKIWFKYNEKFLSIDISRYIKIINGDIAIHIHDIKITDNLYDNPGNRTISYTEYLENRYPYCYRQFKYKYMPIIGGYQTSKFYTQLLKKFSPYLYKQYAFFIDSLE